MTPEQIAVDRELDVLAVKAALMTCSPKYRKDARGELRDEKANGLEVSERRLNFTEEQQERILQRIYDIATSSDNDGVALNACKYVRDDSKGRLDPVKSLGGVTFNVLTFNEAIRRANTLVDEALGLKPAMAEQKVTDV